MTFEDQLRSKINLKTKPLGSLGQLEQLAFQIASVQRTLTPELKNPTLLVFAADHGLAQDGVSAYPPEVTRQMVLNFLNGGAAINVFCKHNQIDLKIVDAGVNFDFDNPIGLISCKADYGTQSSLRGAAMTKDQLQFCLKQAADVINQIADDSCNVIGFGEMGIGNTSAASLLMSNLLQLPISQCVGRGTGLTDEQLVDKTRILEQVIAHHGAIGDPLEALQTFGGFEIAQICGAMLAARERGMLILVDGFIATSAFLVAQLINPLLIDHAVFCHQSNESAHRRLLEHWNAQALLHLELRLGEGSGCALAYPLLVSAVAFLNEMASFESAQISNA